jgi:hypothetical protein
MNAGPGHRHVTFVAVIAVPKKRRPGIAAPPAERITYPEYRAPRGGTHVNACT